MSSPASNPGRPVDAILLAAGKGTRMQSDLPKVLHEVAGKPMLHWVVTACLDAGVDRVIVVVGHRADDVRQAMADFDQLVFVDQPEQLGTGHAVMMAKPAFEAVEPRDAFVLAGDGPLIRPETLSQLLSIHRDQQASATLATAVIDDPTGYGRVLRDPSNGFDRIVEQKDATPEQLAVNEVNPSYYCFASDALFTVLDDLSNDNASGEYYLTDAPGLLKARGQGVAVVDAVPPEDVLSINTLEQLAEVDRILQERLATA